MLYYLLQGHSGKH